MKEIIVVHCNLVFITELSIKRHDNDQDFVEAS